jgi:hypothetical protein
MRWEIREMGVRGKRMKWMCTHGEGICSQTATHYLVMIPERKSDRESRSRRCPKHAFIPGASRDHQ